MKKVISIILSITLILSAAIVFTACKNGGETKGTPVDPSHNSELDPTSGHTVPKIDIELQRIFDEATKELTGASYELVAYGGVNDDEYIFLTVQEYTIPGAKKTYAIVKVSDKDGKAKIDEIFGSELAAITDADAELDGGWAKSGDLTVTEEAKKTLEKASETLAGASFNPIAVLGTQVVAGTNYLIFCEMTATVPNAKTDYAILTVYEDLEGKCEITSTVEFPSPEEGTLQIANPAVGYDRYEEAAKAVGFELDTPDLASASFTVIGGSLFEISFDGGYIRKAKGSDDISGDYNDYPDIKTETVDGKDVTFKGKDGKIFLLTWADGGFSYCVGFEKGVDRSSAEGYINWVK